METLDIFYQGYGIKEMEHIEVKPDHTVAMIKKILFEKHGCEAGTLIFLEDNENPLEDHIIIKELSGPAGAKMHLHRCRHIEVAVTFGGDTVHHRFPPGATVARIKVWAAVTKFGMTEVEAGEHRLQIGGTQERPAPGIHVGTLASCPDCQVRFDLVPDERVNGAPPNSNSGFC
ncbi:MAG: hypothetical protein HY282_07555 [Nitrospirae bacterium]|nr:hypothetical protein [Candidatus Manganitrophaceae bacterium]